VLGAMRILRVQLPGPVAEHQHEKEEEHAGHFEEDNAAHPAERPEESAEALREAAADRARGPSRLARADATGSRAAHTGHRHRGRCRPSAACQALTCHSPRNAESDTQNPANGLRSHPVYDGSSERGWSGFAQLTAAELPFSARRL
jgi:hypothetical protein